MCHYKYTIHTVNHTLTEKGEHVCIHTAQIIMEVQMFKYMDIMVIFHATRDHTLIAIITQTMTMLKQCSNSWT